MMAKRYITEMGMGTDVHGQDYTVAAERAVFDAIHHSSLHFFKHLNKSANDMVIDLMVAVPKPKEVDEKRLIGSLPYGTVNLLLSEGGLEIPGDDEDDAIIIANAGVIVRLDD